MVLTQEVAGNMKSVYSLRKRFLDYIEANQFEVGDRIPSERELSTQLKTSRTTLRKMLHGFENQGAIERRFQGGTFITAPLKDTTLMGHPAIQRQPTIDSNLISAMLIGSPNVPDDQQFIHDYLQERNHILNVYLPGEDKQDPLSEKEFLESLLRLRIKGLLAALTPLPPHNTGLMRQLEREGIGVAHLAYYRSELPDQAFFLPDYRAAGRLAVYQLKFRDIDKIIINPPENTAPFMQLFRQGIDEACSDLGLEIIHHIVPHTHLHINTDESLEMCRTIPERTGIITAGKGAVLKELIRAFGDQAYDFPVIFIDVEKPDDKIGSKFMSLTFSKHQMLKNAMDYLLEPGEHLSHILYQPSLNIPER